MSVAGLLPIQPGDGRWILHTPGGRIAPWLSGKWPSTGRAFINKEHAMLNRSNYSSKLANPARVAYAPAAATEAQRTSFLNRLMAWGKNSVFSLPPGYEIKLLESKGEGIKVFQEEIDTCDREAAVTICGQVVSVDGGTGFSNQDMHRAIRTDIIQDVADQLAYTLNTQGIPQWVARRWGPQAIATAACFEWDVSRPMDLKNEAASLKDCATAIQELNTVLTAVGRKLDVDALTVRYGIPLVNESGDSYHGAGDELARRRLLNMQRAATAQQEALYARETELAARGRALELVAQALAQREAA